MDAALDDLADALHRLDATLDACDDETLARSVRRLAALQTMFQALWLRTIRLADERALHRRDGARDTASWVAGLAGERRGTSRHDVELAVQLAESPLVAEAMSSGEVSKAKAAELVRAADLPEDTQHALVEQARTMPVEHVAAAVEQARLADGLASTPVVPSLTINRRTDRATVEATLDLVDAEMLDVALSTAVESLQLPTTMPYAERRARALGAVARFFLDHQTAVTTGRLGRPHVVVLVDLEVLEARAGGAAMLTSGAVIRGDQARRLAEDANVSRVITSGRSEPLDVGRATRSVSPAIAKAVITRDRCCRYGGAPHPHGHVTSIIENPGPGEGPRPCTTPDCSAGSITSSSIASVPRTCASPLTVAGASSDRNEASSRHDLARRRAPPEVDLCAGRPRYSTRSPEMARLMTSRWISEVPSKIV